MMTESSYEVLEDEDDRLILEGSSQNWNWKIPSKDFDLKISQFDGKERVELRGDKETLENLKSALGIQGAETPSPLKKPSEKETQEPISSNGINVYERKGKMILDLKEDFLLLGKSEYDSLKRLDPDENYLRQELGLDSETIDKLVDKEILEESDGKYNIPPDISELFGEDEHFSETCECGSKDIYEDPDKGEVVCGDCGLVHSDSIDHGPEWRAFDAEQWKSKARTGSPLTLLLHDKGLSADIGGNQDATGKPLPSKTRHKFYWLRKLDNQSKLKTGKEQGLYHGLTYLRKLSERLEISKEAEENAAYYFRKAQTKGSVIGRIRKDVVGACLYAALRESGKPRTYNEIAGITGDKKRLMRTSKSLKKEGIYDVDNIEPAYYLHRYSSDLDLSPEIETKAKRILDHSEREGITSGLNPLSAVAGAIYIASILQGKRITQKEIADSAGVSEVTVRNTYKKIIKAFDDDPLDIVSE